MYLGHYGECFARVMANFLPQAGKEDEYIFYERKGTLYACQAGLQHCSSIFQDSVTKVLECAGHRMA